jgi:hypothetical protein
MSILATILSVILGLAINECSDLSPWAAEKVVRWSARLRYGDHERAAIRAEELAALIKERPGNLFKLITALCFAAAAIPAWTRRVAAALDLSTPVLSADGIVVLKRTAGLATVLATGAVVAMTALTDLSPTASTPPDSLAAAAAKYLSGLGDLRVAVGTYHASVDIPMAFPPMQMVITGFKATGSAQAIVRLGKTTKQDLRVSGNAVRLVIAPPTMTHAVLNLNDSYYVCSYGIRCPSGEVLRSPSVNQVAEEDIYERAEQDPALLSSAEASVRSVLTRRLEGYGFHTVDIEFRS